jgi:Ca2+-binding EF-hand superfamily protein
MTNANQGQTTASRSGVAAIMGDLRDYFEQCDKDQDGRIFYNEFLALLKCLRWGSAPDNLHAEFQSIGIGARTSIDIQDFFTWWMR